MTATAGRRWISPKETAAYLGLAAPAVYRLIYLRQIPAARLGRTWRVDLPALEARLEAQTKVKT